MTKLVSLEEYNKRTYEWHMKQQELRNHGRPNGIACPECGNELVDSDPDAVLLSHPPQKNIKCPKCNYTGLRYC